MLENYPLVSIGKWHVHGLRKCEKRQELEPHCLQKENSFELLSERLITPSAVPTIKSLNEIGHTIANTSGHTEPETKHKNCHNSNIYIPGITQSMHSDPPNPKKTNQKKSSTYRKYIYRRWNKALTRYKNRWRKNRLKHTHSSQRDQQLLGQCKEKSQPGKLRNSVRGLWSNIHRLNPHWHMWKQSLSLSRFL